MSKESGFTILEVMIAIVILVAGLLGVAAMQTKAIQSNVFAGRVTEGCALGEAWMEWLMKQPYDRVAALDTNAADTTATERDLPCDSATVIEKFQEWGLGTFTEEQLPNAIDRGSSLTWRISANSPVQNATTVEIATAVTIKKIDSANNNSSVMTKPVVLRFMMSSHM